VFRAQAGGYDRWRQHASKLDRLREWQPWRADEQCPQSAVDDDRVREPAWTPYCELPVGSPARRPALD